MSFSPDILELQDNAGINQIPQMLRSCLGLNHWNFIESSIIREDLICLNLLKNAVADHRIRKIESELERDNATMGDIYELNTAMKLTKEGMNAGEAIDMAAEMRANAECIEAE